MLNSKEQLMSQARTDGYKPEILEKVYPMQISFRFLHTKDLEIFSQQCA